MEQMRNVAALFAAKLRLTFTRLLVNAALVNCSVLTAQFEFLTLKAFANSSPGLRFGNPGKEASIGEDANLKGLRRGTPLQPDLSWGCDKTKGDLTPRVSKQTLGWNLPTLSALGSN